MGKREQGVGGTGCCRAKGECAHLPAVGLKLNVKDEIPVQKTYYSIPKPLYPEVKSYIEDMLNRGWIRKSESAYASPVVLARKKCGKMRLCVDYRELNKKTIPDQYPLPRVLEMLDSL